MDKFLQRSQYIAILDVLVKFLVGNNQPGYQECELLMLAALTALFSLSFFGLSGYAFFLVIWGKDAATGWAVNGRCFADQEDAITYALNEGLPETYPVNAEAKSQGWMIGALITFGLISFSSFFIQLAHSKFESYRNAYEKPEMEKLNITDRKQLPDEIKKESKK